MQFNFSYAPGLSLDQIKGFELAGKIWASYLKDNVTINIAVDIQQDFPGNAIAGAAPRLNIQGFLPYQDRLKKDYTSASDRALDQAQNLITSGNFSGRFDLFDAAGNNKGFTVKTTAEKINVNSANTKAVGLSLPGGSGILDGYVVMRDLTGAGVSWNYDFARTAPTPSKTLDFVSVAIHEIGHILGFQSSVDRPGWLNPRTNGNQSAETAYTNSLEARLDSSTPLDLFRYSDRSNIGLDSAAFKPIDLAVGSNPYFSYQNGKSPVAYFDTGIDLSLGGSGLQASHWKTAGIMNAVINQASRPAITAADLNALDIIGYDPAPQGASTSINYAQLLQQVNQSLAQRIGKTVDWLNANPTPAANQLTKDITASVSTMLDNSSVYKRDDATVWSNGARGKKWWQDFKQTFFAEGIFESLGNEVHDREHEHDRDELSGEIIDLLTGLSGNEPILNADSLENFLAQDFSDNSLDELELGQLLSDFDLGNMAQTTFGNGAIASWLQQNFDNLIDLNFLENSTNGGNPIYDLGVNV